MYQSQAKRKLCRWYFSTVGFVVLFDLFNAAHVPCWLNSKLNGKQRGKELNFWVTRGNLLDDACPGGQKNLQSRNILQATPVSLVISIQPSCLHVCAQYPKGKLKKKSAWKSWLQSPSPAGVLSEQGVSFLTDHKQQKSWKTGWHQNQAMEKLVIRSSSVVMLLNRHRLQTGANHCIERGEEALWKQTRAETQGLVAETIAVWRPRAFHPVLSGHLFLEMNSFKCAYKISPFRGKVGRSYYLCWKVEKMLDTQWCVVLVTAA